IPRTNQNPRRRGPDGVVIVHHKNRERWLVRKCPPRRPAEKLFGVTWFECLPEVPTLTASGGRRAQLDKLLLELDPLSDNIDAHPARQPDDGHRDCTFASVLAETGDERPVDLELIDGKALEVPQRGVARAEVVYRDAHTVILQAVEANADRVLVGHDHRLSDLECEEAGIQTSQFQRPGD